MGKDDPENQDFCPSRVEIVNVDLSPLASPPAMNPKSHTHEWVKCS